MNTNLTAGAVKAKNLAAEFLDFMKQFGVIGLAIGIIVGTAVKDYVDAVVKTMVDPLVKTILALVKFSPNGKFDLITTTVKDKVTGIETSVTQSLEYGTLISETINFLVLMFIVFVSVKFFIARFMDENDQKHTGVK